MILFASQTCPLGFSAKVSQNIFGRLIVNHNAPHVSVFGSSNLLRPLGSGPDSHLHTSWSIAATIRLYRSGYYITGSRVELGHIAFANESSDQIVSILKRSLGHTRIAPEPGPVVQENSIEIPYVRPNCILQTVKLTSPNRLLSRCANPRALMSELC